MSELKLSARLRMMAKGSFTRGDVISADRLSRAAIEHDSLVDQLAAAKADIAEYRILLESVALIASPNIANKIDETLAKHKGE